MNESAGTLRSQLGDLSDLVCIAAERKPCSPCLNCERDTRLSDTSDAVEHLLAIRRSSIVRGVWPAARRRPCTM